MSIRIDTTVGNAAEDLAKAGLPGGRHVTMLVLDEEDEARLAELRAAIAEADASGDFVEADEALEMVRRRLADKFPSPR